MDIYKKPKDDGKKKKRENIGHTFVRMLPEENADGGSRVLAVFVEKLDPDTEYEIVFTHEEMDEDLTSAESSQESAVGTTFSLKLHFAEEGCCESYNGSATVLPGDIDSISREHRWVPGMRESSFLLGTRPNLRLFGQEDDAVAPYQPKQTKVYSTHGTNPMVKAGKEATMRTPIVVTTIPFDVLTPMEMFSVGLYDYSHAGSSLLNIGIVSSETAAIVAMADQGKYYS
jgi:hypothetical protein